MPEPELYNWYATEQAISFFGSPDDGRYLCDGQWVIFPKIALCFAEIGKAEQKSHFRNAARFCWAAEQPYQVSDAPLARFVPAEVTVPRRTRLFGPHPSVSDRTTPTPFSNRLGIDAVAGS